MIVTCPGCASKYRVRNEAVPAEGARMRCPKCETLFLAKPPPAGLGDDSASFDAPTGQFAPATGQFGVPGGPSLPPGFAPPAGAGFSQPPGTGSSPFGAFGAPPASSPPSPSPFGDPAPSPFSGLPPAAPSPSPFGASPGTSPSPFGASPGTSPSPFGASPGTSPFGASPGTSPSPFGASPGTSPSPFGAAPSPFGAAPSPFGAPSPSPFGGAPSPSPFGAAPANPNNAGPLTAMMARFDPSSPPPQSLPPQSLPPQPRPAPDDDPFASIDLGNRPSPGESMASRPPTQSPPVVVVPRPATQAAPAAPARPRAHRGESLAPQLASWAFLAFGLASAGAGAVFAGWTSGAVDLDATLMPKAEETLGVRPPYSFIGADDVALDALRRDAKAREDAGDLPAAAVLWRKVIDRDAADATAKAALPRVLTALGERLR